MQDCCQSDHKVLKMSNNDGDASDRNVEIWKIKKLIKSLELARG